MRPINPLLDEELQENDCAALESPYVIRGMTATRRELRLALRAKTAVEAVGAIYRGCDIFGLTKGQFSLIHIIEAVIAQMPPPKVSVSTWTANLSDVETLRAWMDAGRITALRCVVDFSFQRREPKIAHALRQGFGTEAIRVSKNHSKFILLDSAPWKITIKTSMNLNANPRMEDFEIVDDPSLFGFLDGVLDEIFRRQSAKDIDERPYENVKRFNAL